MRIGIFGGEPTGIDEAIGDAKAAAEQGFNGYWVSQIFGFDNLTVLAIVGREVPGIELGTGVVPTYPRHPIMLAQQALTVNVATGGRLALGIGLSHQIVIENMFGLSFEKPLRHMREYLSILVPLIQTGTVSFTGETLSANATISVPGATPCPVLVAALGPKMLELAGTVADGTVTWMTGANTLGSYTVPTITKAAAAAGRPNPASARRCRCASPAMSTGPGHAPRTSTRCTGCCRPTGRCSTAKARRGPRISRSWATKRW
jgi:F420-dependent oxidoreductase-like protein